MIEQILQTALILLLSLPQAQQGQAQPSAAEAAFDRAIELQRQGRWSEALGLAYLRLKRTEVKTMIDRLAATVTGEPFAHLLRGQNYLADSDFQHAAESLESAEA